MTQGKPAGWKKFVYPIVIREGHLDSFGHVNNATYLELFEEARWEIITEGGYGFEKIHETQVGPIILELSVRFQREILLRQKILIETQVLEHSGRIGRLAQTMRNAESGEVHATAEFKLGLLDMRKRKLIQPTPEWLTALGAPAGDQNPN